MLNFVTILLFTYQPIIVTTWVVLESNPSGDGHATPTLSSASWRTKPTELTTLCRGISFRFDHFMNEFSASAGF